MSEDFCFLPEVFVGADDFSHLYKSAGDFIETLESNGNSSANWFNVKIKNDNLVESLKHIKNCVFNGSITIGKFNGGVHAIAGISIETTTGLFNSHFSGVLHLDDDVIIKNAYVHNTLISYKACIIGKCIFI